MMRAIDLLAEQTDRLHNVMTALENEAERLADLVAFVDGSPSVFAGVPNGRAMLLAAAQVCSALSGAARGSFDLALLRYQRAGGTLDGLGLEPAEGER